MKKIISVLVAVLLLCTLIPAVFAAEETTFTASAANAAEKDCIEKGDTVKVTVYQTGAACAGFHINDFSYDKEKLQLIGTDADGDGWIEPAPGEGLTVLYGPKGINAMSFVAKTDRVAFVLEFVVLAESGTATISFGETTADGKAAVANGCTITIAHEHSFGEWKVVKAATCTEKGLEERVCACGEKETREIEMIPHTPAAAVKENEKAADCVNAGSYDEVVYCSVCKTELDRKTVEIPALGHDVVKGEIPAYDCKDGYEVTNTCSRCDWTETVKVEGHDHVWGPWTATKEATYEEEGEKVRKCEHTDHGCTASETASIPVLNPEEPDPTGDITPYIAMGVLTMVALVSAAAYMLLKRKAI